jgi:putative spermidine/putrescine transport system substrate-binding protein
MMRRPCNKETRYGDGFSGRDVARRRLLQGAAASVGTALFAPYIAKAATGSLEGQMVFAANGGLQEQMFRELGTTFEQRTGTKVTVIAGTMMGNLAKVQVARNAPDTDVVFNSDLSHVAGKHTGLFEKIDPAVVTNRTQVYDTALDPDNIGIGCCVTSIGIGYNTQKYQQAGIPAPTSWNDLWDPRLKGKLAICTFGQTWTQDFLVLMARLAGGSESNINPGIAKIKELKTNGNLVLMPDTPAEMENIVTQGLAWVNVTASIRAYLLRDSGFPFDFVYPKEGASLFGDWLDVVKNAPHPNAAQAFVNHVLSDVGQMILAKNYYGPTNKTVILPPELARVAPYGERMKSLVPLDRSKMNDDLDQWNDLYNREIVAK